MLTQSSSFCLSVSFSETFLGFDPLFLIALSGGVSCSQLLLLLESSLSAVFFVGSRALSLPLYRLEHGYYFSIQVLGPNSTANSIMAAYQQKRMLAPVVQG